ncbi:MAG: DUF3387 domain-containing protein [Thermincola sp.]|nr:DUF3387 domain-containing protein [Thermincola sp.]
MSQQNFNSSRSYRRIINLGKDIQKMDKEPHEMGLSEYEYAFYSAHCKQ